MLTAKSYLSSDSTPHPPSLSDFYNESYLGFSSAWQLYCHKVKNIIVSKPHLQ